VKPLEVGEAGPELLQTPTNKERKGETDEQQEKKQTGPIMTWQHHDRGELCERERDDGVDRASKVTLT
jgi:hypothetical protein